MAEVRRVLFTDAEMLVRHPAGETAGFAVHLAARCLLLLAVVHVDGDVEVSVIAECIDELVEFNPQPADRLQFKHGARQTKLLGCAVELLASTVRSSEVQVNHLMEHGGDNLTAIDKGWRDEHLRRGSVFAEGVVPAFLVVTVAGAWASFAGSESDRDEEGLAGCACPLFEQEAEPVSC